MICDEKRILATVECCKRLTFIRNLILLSTTPGRTARTVKWLMHARTRGIIEFYISAEVRRAAKSGLYAATVL